MAEEDSRNYKTALLKHIYRHFAFRNFDVSRISFAISESREERTLLWIIPAGGRFPKYILKEDYQLIKATDLNKKLQELFPKK